MKRKWPQKVFRAGGGDWLAPITSQMAVDLFPKNHTLRAILMLLQVGYTCEGREFSIPDNARNCWEVDKIQISRAKAKLKEAGLLVEIPEENNGVKRRYRLTEKAMAYRSPEKMKCQTGSGISERNR